MTTISYHEKEVYPRDGNFAFEIDTKGGTVQVLSAQPSAAELIVKYIVIREEQDEPAPSRSAAKRTTRKPLNTTDKD